VAKVKEWSPPTTAKKHHHHASAAPAANTTATGKSRRLVDEHSILGHPIDTMPPLSPKDFLGGKWKTAYIGEDWRASDMPLSLEERLWRGKSAPPSVITVAKRATVAGYSHEVYLLKQCDAGWRKTALGGCMTDR